MKTFNFVLAGFWAAMAVFHFAFQHPATWWVAGIMSIALALRVLDDALDD